MERTFPGRLAPQSARASAPSSRPFALRAGVDALAGVGLMAGLPALAQDGGAADGSAAAVAQNVVLTAKD